MKLTGEITTSVSAMSEGVFWDFVNDAVSKDVMEHFGFSQTLLPKVQDVFSEHGRLSPEVAELLGLSAGISVTYKSGDQPNNALSLNVLKPGEVAATAGTSGVIYGVSDKLIYDQDSRINSFAHVNYSSNEKRIGVLLCINGVGILNKWVKALSGAPDYKRMNEEAVAIKPGSDGLRVLPFGNGAERMLNNKIVGAHFKNIDLNIHSQAHVFRASQEGIAFAFRYGLDIMRKNGMSPQIIRAGKANMFLSKVFCQSFVNACNTPVELFENDGSVGAAIGAGIGAGAFGIDEVFAHMSAAKRIEPKQHELYEELYQDWKTELNKELTSRH
jgi:xylulokinase